MNLKNINFDSDYYKYRFYLYTTLYIAFFVIFAFADEKFRETGIDEANLMMDNSKRILEKIDTNNFNIIFNTGSGINATRNEYHTLQGILPNIETLISRLGTVEEQRTEITSKIINSDSNTVNILGKIITEKNIGVKVEGIDYNLPVIAMNKLAFSYLLCCIEFQNRYKEAAQVWIHETPFKNDSLKLIAKYPNRVWSNDKDKQQLQLFLGVDLYSINNFKSKYNLIIDTVGLKKKTDGVYYINDNREYQYNSKAVLKHNKLTYEYPAEIIYKVVKPKYSISTLDGFDLTNSPILFKGVKNTFTVFRSGESYKNESVFGNDGNILNLESMYNVDFRLISVPNPIITLTDNHDQTYSVSFYDNPWFERLTGVKGKINSYSVEGQSNSDMIIKVDDEKNIVITENGKPGDKAFIKINGTALVLVVK